MSTKQKKHHKGLWITLITILSVIAVLFASFFIYAGIYQHPTEEAKAVMKADDIEIEETKDYITFAPKTKLNLSGYIFYPGGKVDPVAYAPYLHDLAKSGVNCVLVKMPFRLAFFNINGADSKKELFPNTKNWFLGGHSLGGAMCSEYIAKHPDDFKGLVLLASYSTKDLSEKNFSTLSLRATNDKVLNQEKYEKNKKNLPNLTEVTIDGGIHSFFGDYGIQNKDGEPTITVEEQRTQVVASQLYFMTKVLLSSLKV